jgi:hypothetical protein
VLVLELVFVEAFLMSAGLYHDLVFSLFQDVEGYTASKFDYQTIVAQMASIAGSRQKVYILLVGVINTVSATCYRPDGLAMDAAYQPCNGSALV